MQWLKRKSKAFSFLILFGNCPIWAVQQQTYPTAATTKIREDTYVDDISTLALSTQTVICSGWNLSQTSKGFNYFSVSPSTINIWTGLLADTTTVVPVNLSIQDYTDLIVNETRNKTISEIANNTEVYSVWPDTSPPPGWSGWCLKIINGKNVAVACDQSQ